jgi:HTH-type transcriptional repressor of NAD biosynthesis genes
MRRGVLLGKFLPPHRGHQYMIDFARRCVDELSVFVCSIRAEPIPGKLRFEWMRDHFGGVRVVHCEDENPQEPAEDPDHFWPIWRQSLLARMDAPPDVVFASEPYGVRLAQELGAAFVPVDPLRQTVSISARQIRADPRKYAEFILPEARPYFTKRVVLVGPESSGKSTLTSWLASHFGTMFVAEYGRTFQENVGRDLCLGDMLEIAYAHRAAEDAVSMQAKGLIFIDTEAIITKLWSEVFFDAAPEGLEPFIDPARYHLYLLAEPHPHEWHDDGWRLQPDRAERMRFFEKMRLELEARNCPYRILSGDWTDRQVQAVQHVEALLDPPPGTGDP